VNLFKSVFNPLTSSLILSVLLACNPGAPVNPSPKPDPIIVPPVSGLVTLEPGAIQGLPVGGACQLRASSKDGSAVSWSSSNPGLIRVSDSGLVTALAEGDATITAKSISSEAKAVVAVRVSNPVNASLELGPSDLKVSFGDTVALEAKASNLACASLSWSAVGGTVSQEGLFTASSTAAVPGSVRVTAITGSVSKSAEMPVTPAFWSQTTQGDTSTSSRIFALAVSPGGVLHLGNEAGVFRLDPSSDSWVALRGVSGGLSNIALRSLAFTPDGTLYAGTREGVYRQAPGSSSWQRTQTFDVNSTAAYSSGLPNNRDTNSLQVKDGKVYAGMTSWNNAGTVRNVFVYDPTVDRWDALGTFPVDSDVNSITWAGGALYAATRNEKVFRWDGTTWTAMGTLTGFYGLETGPDDKVYASRAQNGDNGLSRLDGATTTPTWTKVLPSFPLSSSLRVGSELLIGDGPTVKRGLSTWTGIGPNLQANADVIAANPSGRVFAAVVKSNVWSVWRSPKATITGTGSSVNVSSVAIQPGSVPYLRVGVNQPLKAIVGGQNSGGVFWLSSNSSVVKVDAQGMLTGVSSGTSTITARARDDINQSAQIAVTVSDPAASIASVTIAAPSSELEVGAKLQLRASLETSYFGTLSTQSFAAKSVAEPDRRVNWTSSNPGLASVDANGLVTGLGTGNVQITATSVANPNAKAQVNLSVIPALVIPNGAGQWQLEATLGATPSNTWVRALEVHGNRLYASVSNAGVWSRDLGNTLWRQEQYPNGSNLPVFESMTSNGDTLFGGLQGKLVKLTSSGWVDQNLGFNRVVKRLLWAQNLLWLGFDADTTVNADVYKLENGAFVRTGAGLPVGNNNTDGALNGLLYSNGILFTLMSNGWVYKLEAGAWVTHATRQVDRNGVGIRLQALAADQAGNLYTTTKDSVTKLEVGSNIWQQMHRVPGARGMVNSSDSLLIAGFSAAYQIKLSTGELIKLGQNELPANHDLAAITYDGLNKTVFIGINTPLAGEGNLYRITPDPRAVGVSNNLEVSSATYLGAAGGDSAGGVDIAPDGTIIMAGRLERTDLGVSATHLLGGGAGAVVRLSADGKKVLGVTRLGDAIQDIEVNRTNGQIAVIGDFGTAVLSSDAQNIIWSKPEPSNDEGRRIAMGADGTVVTLTNKVIRTYSSDGSKMGELTLNNSFVLDVALDSSSQSVFLTGMDNKKLPPDNTLPNAPVQVAYLYSYPYNLSARKWTNWNYSGLDLNGQEADTRGYRVSMGRDNKLYFLGENAGGNSIFRFDPRSPIGIVSNGRPGMIEQDCNCWIRSDEYNIGYNAASAHFAYYARIEPASGTVLKGQFAVPRLPNTKSNTFRVRAITADEQGRVYIGGISAYALENRSGKKIAGQSTGEYGGTDVTMLVVSEDFKTRLIWTAWNKEGPNDSNANGIREAYDAFGSEVVGFAASNGTAVIAARAGGGQLVTVNALQASPSPDLSKSNSDAFVGVFPMR
jgi:uncharacterized protein YjdB